MAVPLGMKVWVPLPDKEPWPAEVLSEGKRNTEWVVEEGSYKCPATIMGPAIEMRAIIIINFVIYFFHIETIYSKCLLSYEKISFCYV